MTALRLAVGPLMQQGGEDYGPWATPIDPSTLGSALKHRYTYEHVVTSGSDITEFTDIAGSVDMTTGPGASPAQLTGPAATFSTLDGYGNLSTVIPELEACEFTLFFVVNPINTGDFRSVMAVARYNGGSLSSATSNPWVLAGFGSSSGALTVAARNNAGASSAVDTSSTPASNGVGPHVIAMQVKSGVTNGTKIWVNNGLYQTGTLTKPAGATTLDSSWLSGRPFHVGGYDDEFQGDFYEAVLCDDSLTEEQILGVMSWLHFEHSTVEPPP